MSKYYTGRNGHTIRLLSPSTNLLPTLPPGEEVSNAPVAIPRAMVLTILINGFLAFGILLAALFSIGDVEKALNSPTGYPIIEIFYQATGSTRAATAMMSAIIVIAFTSTFGILAATSRLTWAFARDRGLPFSEFFAYVRMFHLLNCYLGGPQSTVTSLLTAIG